MIILGRNVLFFSIWHIRFLVIGSLQTQERMNYRIIKSPPHLAGYIRFFWVLESDRPFKKEPFIYRSVADGSAEIIFTYLGRFTELSGSLRINQPLSHVHAQSQVYRRFETFDQFGIFGVYLYPFVIPLLFSMPSDEFSGELPELLTVSGNEGGELEEKIMLATDHELRVKIFSEFVEEKLRKGNQPESSMLYSIKNIINTHGAVSVEQLADQCGLSRRQFERKFKEHAGFSPMLYSRIIRFQSAIKFYNSCGKSLTELAYQCGYYDQSHFIHDFKKFSGFHPKVYFRSKPEGAEYQTS
jgi:AraC-like DNA-binding protein